MKSSLPHCDITGKIASYNVGPKGVYESVLIKDAAKTMQVNFRPEEGDDISHRTKKGQTVTFEVTDASCDETSKHPVFAFVAMKPSSEESKRSLCHVNVEGTVVQLNYARDGAINGAILCSGDYVHLHREGARLVDLSIGQTLVVAGKEKRSCIEHRIIEAETVNGAEIEHRHTGA